MKNINNYIIEKLKVNKEVAEVKPIDKVKEAFKYFNVEHYKPEDKFYDELEDYFNEHKFKDIKIVSKEAIPSVFKSNSGLDYIEYIPKEKYNEKLERYYASALDSIYTLPDPQPKNNGDIISVLGNEKVVGYWDIGLPLSYNVIFFEKI